MKALVFLVETTDTDFAFVFGLHLVETNGKEVLLTVEKGLAGSDGPAMLRDVELEFVVLEFTIVVRVKGSLTDRSFTLLGIKVDIMYY